MDFLDIMQNIIQICSFTVLISYFGIYGTLISKNSIKNKLIGDVFDFLKGSYFVHAAPIIILHCWPYKEYKQTCFR